MAIMRETTWDMEIGGVCVAQIDCRVEWSLDQYGDPEIGVIELDGWVGKTDARVTLDGGDHLYGMAASQIEEQMDARVLEEIRMDLEIDERMDAPSKSRRAA